MAEGEPLRVTTTLEATGGARDLEIREALPRNARLIEGTNHVHTHIPSGRSLELEFRTTFVTRGTHPIGPLVARLTDPFGLVYEEHELAEQESVLVEPATERLKDVALRSTVARVNLGTHITRRSGDGFEFYAIRPYNPGDSPRMVNWKASARTDDLLVNQRSHESFADITFLVDCRESAEVGVERYTPLAQGARATASLADYFLSQRDTVRIYLYGDGIRTIHPSTPGHQLRDVLKELALTQGRGDLRLSDVVERVRPKLKYRSPIVIVSALENDPTAAQAFRQLVAGDHDVLVISPEPAGFDAENPAERLRALQRERTLQVLRGYGASVLDWSPGAPFSTSIMEGIY